MTTGDWRLRSGWEERVITEKASRPQARNLERLHEPGYAQQLLRRTRGSSNFAVPFTIIVFITVLFMLPRVNPINRDTFKHTPVAVGAVLAFAGGWWLLSARTWFKGPMVGGTPEELRAIEAELSGAAEPALAAGQGAAD